MAHWWTYKQEDTVTQENMYQLTLRQQYIQTYILHGVQEDNYYKHQCNGIQSSLQLTVESDNTIEIATLSA